MKKYILFISLIVNFIFIGVALRHFILSHKKNITSNVNFFVNRDVLLKSLPSFRSDIVFVGDSHTQNFELFEILKNQNVRNRGIFYDTSLGVKKRINDIAKRHPAKVFIEIGINDLQRKIPLNQIAANISNIISALKSSSPETKIYLQSVLPVAKSYTNADSINKIREQLNKIYFRICIQYKITFVNLDNVFLTNGYLLEKYDVGDRIHLNYQGYLKWSEILRQYLK